MGINVILGFQEWWLDNFTPGGNFNSIKSPDCMYMRNQKVVLFYDKNKYRLLHELKNTPVKISEKGIYNPISDSKYIHHRNILYVAGVFIGLIIKK